MLVFSCHFLENCVNIRNFPFKKLRISPDFLCFFFFLKLQKTFISELCFYTLIFIVKWHAWREGVWVGSCREKAQEMMAGVWERAAQRAHFANGNTFLPHERNKTILRQSSPSAEGMKRSHKRLFLLFFSLFSVSLSSWLGLPWQDRQTSTGLSLRLRRRLNSRRWNLISL